MDDDGVIKFIQSNLRSIWAIELLVILRRGRQPWALVTLETELRGSATIARKATADLVRLGFALESSPGVWQYQPMDEARERLAAEIERLHRERPAALARAVYEGTDDAIRSFADAFRFRKH